MKKLLLLLLFASCSNDDCIEYNPCDCILVTDPVTWQSTDNTGLITYTTYFVGKNECNGFSEPYNNQTTDINKIPKEFSCYKE